MLGLMRWHRFAVLFALAGCASGPSCTLIGCASQLTVRLPAGTTAGTACVAGVCTSEVVEGALLVPLGRRADGDTAQVTVTLGARTYAGEVALQRTRPNGDACPPVCVNGTAALDGERVVTA
ncbi:MAG: hypothetical protein JWM62_2055 [Frankiales bacterium]|jgi:hypothetical protein|nr:hypothetical protein [Frankiales bacterium]